MLKNSVFKFVVFALWSVLFAAVPAAEDPDVETTALEAKIRQELSLLRSRLLELETLLDLLQAGSGAAEVDPVQDSGKAAVGEAVPPTQKPVVSGLRDQELSSGVVSSGGQAISFTGLLDAYFTHNTNSPPDGYNMLYYTNPNARGFGLNQAKIEIDASGDGPIGFRSDIWFGSGARLFRDGLEPGPLEDVLYLQQAYGYYQSSSGARLDVGLFGTIAGLEVPESHLNWNYSRGILWVHNEPFSHLGAQLSIPMTDTFTSTVMFVNGFDNAWDQNTGKSYGLQGSFAPNDSFNTTLTWINGPENWGTNEGWLKNLSWNVYRTLHERLELMANLDYIQANDPELGSATSWGIGGYARGHVSDQVRIAYRFEFMDDTDAWSTGFEQNLRENTYTLEVQPVKDDPRFLTRIEYRRDWSDIPFFSCGNCASGMATKQDTFTVGMMWIFGPKQ